MSVTTSPLREALLREIAGSPGVHSPSRSGDPRVPCGCRVVEAVASYVDVSLSRRSRLFCPTLELFVAQMSDMDAETQDVVGGWVFGHLDELVGTAQDGYSEARALFVADQVSRVILPGWLDAAGAGDVAAVLRALPAIVDRRSAAGAHGAIMASGVVPDWWKARARLLRALPAVVAERVKGKPVQDAFADVADVVARAAVDGPVVAGTAWRAAADGAAVIVGRVATTGTLPSTCLRPALGGLANAFAEEAARFAADGVAAGLAMAVGCSTARLPSVNAWLDAMWPRVFARLDERRAEHGLAQSGAVAVELLRQLVSVGRDAGSGSSGH